MTQALLPLGKAVMQVERSRVYWSNLPCMIGCLQNSIAVVETVDASLVSFVAQFWASTTVVDEPVAHLCHADSRGLQFLPVSSGF